VLPMRLFETRGILSGSAHTEREIRSGDGTWVTCPCVPAYELGIGQVCRAFLRSGVRRQEVSHPVTHLVAEFLLRREHNLRVL
jgi:hypothetical protein